MTSLKTLLKTIDIENTDWEKFDWSSLGIDFGNHREVDTSDLDHDEVVKLNVIRGFWMVYGNKRNLGELKRNLREPKRKPAFRMPKLEKIEPQSRSGRTYYYSVVFRNAAVLRLLTKKFTRSLRERKRNLGEPRWVHSRIIDQMDSEARSVVANIREGYGRPTTIEYIRFLGYSKGSLEEFRGDVIDLRDDGLLKSVPGSSLADVGINLRPPKDSPPSYDHLRALKRTIRGLKSEDLTFEIFMELINKTDYLLRRTVEGLREKIIEEGEESLKQELDSIWRKYWG